LLFIVIAVAASVMTYSWVMSMVSAQSRQAQTQVRIDSVSWDIDANTITLVVRNTGSVSATIEQVSIRENREETTWYSKSVTRSIAPGSTDTFTWTGALTLERSSPYVIRVTTTTGFYYELVASSPA